jgi:hypothetical protein
MNIRYLACCVLLLAACNKKASGSRTREEFCHDWAIAACSAEVVSVCQAASAEACHVSQEAFCRKLVPMNFSDATGDECIAAVKDAYTDADLKASELATVLRLAKPCDGLVSGPKREGDSCMERKDCDASADLQCVRKSNAASGVCEVPEVVGGGRSCTAVQKTCEAGFYCNGANCIEAKASGEDCTIQEECGETGFCGDDGKCAKRLAVGEACTSDRECNAGICYEFQGSQLCTDRIRLARSEPLCDNLR